MKPLTKIIFFIFQFFCFIIFFSFRVLLTFVMLLLKQGSQLLQNDWFYKFVNELFCMHKVQERVTPTTTLTALQNWCVLSIACASRGVFTTLGPFPAPNFPRNDRDKWSSGNVSFLRGHWEPFRFMTAAKVHTGRAYDWYKLNKGYHPFPAWNVRVDSVNELQDIRGFHILLSFLCCGNGRRDGF